MGGTTGPPVLPPSLLLDPHLPPYSTLAFPAHLQDLACRFIVNLPADELSSIERICFQVEQAHWFYEDFLRPLNPTLPSLNLRKFSTHLLSTSAQIVPFIKQYVTASSSNGGSSGELEMNLEKAFDDFLKYKTRVPVCGIIILDEKWEKCLLVKGWKASSAWGFPKGKINQSESTRDCAVREVYEETGFDCNDILPSDSTDYLELTMREQKIRLYIAPGVSEDTHFETMTRKEISKIAWFRLRDLPAWKHNSGDTGNGKFYSVAPFTGRLKSWIAQNRKSHPRRPKVKQGISTTHAVEEDQDEAEAVQAEQTRQLLDRLFAPITNTAGQDSVSATNSTLGGADALPTGTALLDHLFGRTTLQPTTESQPIRTQPTSPISATPNGQALLDILFGKGSQQPPPPPQSNASSSAAPQTAQASSTPNGGQALLDMLFGNNRRESTDAARAPIPPGNGPTSSAQALLNSLFNAAASTSQPPFTPGYNPMFAPFVPPGGAHGPPLPPPHMLHPQHFPPPFFGGPGPPTAMSMPPPLPSTPGASIPLSFFLGGASPSQQQQLYGGPPPPPSGPPLPPPPPNFTNFPPRPPPPRSFASARALGPPPIPVPLPPAPLPPSPAGSRPGPASSKQASLLLNILKPSGSSGNNATGGGPLGRIPASASSPVITSSSGAIASDGSLMGRSLGEASGSSTSNSSASPVPPSLMPPQALAPHQANLLSTLMGNSKSSPASPVQAFRQQQQQPPQSILTPPTAHRQMPASEAGSAPPPNAHQANLLNTLLGGPTAPSQPASQPQAAPSSVPAAAGSASPHQANLLKTLLGGGGAGGQPNAPATNHLGPNPIPPTAHVPNGNSPASNEQQPDGNLSQAEQSTNSLKALLGL